VSASGVRILIAGDDLESLETTAWYLRKEGYSVSTAVGLFAVLRAVLMDHPDLIVLEHGQMGTCAEAVATTAQNHTELKRIPLIVLSPVPESRLAAFDLVSFHRPYNYGRLVEAINAILGGEKASRAAFRTTKRLKPVAADPED
jgi:DNA-binding response OmpR family regulator